MTTFNSIPSNTGRQTNTKETRNCVCKTLCPKPYDCL